MTLEMGKALAESRAEIAYAAEFFRWFSEEAVRIHGRYMVNTTGKGRILTMRQPVGPCVFVTPWNFPTAMGTRKIAPAIAAGCTMVVKPAQQTPLSMLALAQILEQAGLPGGVLNVITAKHSGAVIEPLLKDPRTRKLSFTGSTEVGRTLIEQSAEQILRVSMELGGNAPFLVFDDADLDAAVDGALIAKMRNVGEACTAANRFHVHESIADEFARRLAERHGRAEGRSRHRARRGRRPADRRQTARQGRRARRGRRRAGRRGAARRRTASTAPATSTSRPCSAACPTTRACWTRRSSGRSPRSRPSPPTSRRSPPPTAPSTGSSPTSTRATSTAPSASARASRSGMVGLNQGVVSNPAAPFGGVKQSGFGREGGFEGIGEYLETKYVAMGV